MRFLFFILLLPIVASSQLVTFSFAGLTPTSPYTITGQTSGTITGLSITNLNQGTQGGKNLRLINCSNITITGNYFGASWGAGIEMENCSNITIENNFFGNNRAGVYALTCTGGIIVRWNQFINVHSWGDYGQYVQLNQCSGTGNLIDGNVGECFFAESRPEDLISLYGSQGTSGSRITVSNNIFRGGGPSNSGGGIMLGDGGGQYQTATGNKLVEPGQYGIAISGGDYCILNNNEVYGTQKPWSNIGWYVANYSGLPTCSNMEVTNNKTNYINSAGVQNDAYNSGDCGTIVETGNTYGQSLASMGVPTFLFNITENESWIVRDECTNFSSQIALSRPTANAGSDQSISIATATLSGSGGTSYQWVQVSGPNTATMSAPTSATNNLSGLVNGTYQFRLQAYGTTDGQQVADADWVNIVVSGVGANYGIKGTFRFL